MMKAYEKILINIFVFSGNGVENAFSYSKKVFTLSYHKYEPGFYPGTGNLDDIGHGNGRGYTCNIPLKEGVSDETLTYLFQKY